MQLHQIPKPIHKPKKKKQICRGGAHGFHGGRGNEGQKARAGKRLQPIIRELIKKYPKLRGYKFKRSIPNSQLPRAIVNLVVLEKKFNSGEKITPMILLKKRIIAKIKGRAPQIKILGGEKISKKFVIEGCQISKSAKEQIEKAGGSVKM